MGDDARFECIYKFVSEAVYGSEPSGLSPLDIGDRFLDRGILYVARFDADGAQTGAWIPLVPEQPALRAANRDQRTRGLFASLDSIVVHARAAARAVGATPMDRPEWGAVHPRHGEVYFSLTNNVERGADAVHPANPRAPNRDGHIIRMRESGDEPAATTFSWEIFAFGAAADDAPRHNRSGLTADNAFSSCDGLWFRSGRHAVDTDRRRPAGRQTIKCWRPSPVASAMAASTPATAQTACVGSWSDRSAARSPAST